MIVDDGVVRFDLHRHERGAPTGTVLLLPPHIAHTGRSGSAAGSFSCFFSTVFSSDGAELARWAADGSGFAGDIFDIASRRVDSEEAP